MREKYDRMDGDLVDGAGKEGREEERRRRRTRRWRIQGKHDNVN